MPSTLSDTYGYRAPDGTLVPLANQLIYAAPGSPTYRVDYAGDYHPLNAINPNITAGSAAVRYGVVAQTDSSGQWSFVLPYGDGETHPADPLAKWSLLFPDGSVLTGTVPADPGPFAVDDLITDHGWTWASQVYVAPVTAGVFAKGTAVFSGGSATATIVFLSPFVLNTYQLTLAPSVDSVDGTIPRVAWANKTTTGFDLVCDTADYQGQVDWSAQL